MQYHLNRKGTNALTLPLLSVCHAVLPENGEDSFALCRDERGALLCVADGCGGLGSRRYPALGNQTGAYIAARLVTRAVAMWAQEREKLPSAPLEGERFVQTLQEHLEAILCGFAQKNGGEAKSRIVGSMQRDLPSTLCAALTADGAARWREVCFLWAGDSRGYVLDENGLHQCTQDHLRGSPDAFDSLYHDAPLSRLLCADRHAEISLRRLRAPLPCMILTATDGAYSSLMNPMEFEMLLLDTLMSARSWESWEKKLSNRLKKLAQDDATLLLEPCGVSGFDEMKQKLLPRRAILQKQFVTPCRRHCGNTAYQKEKWLLYRETYDWTLGGNHERMDWRL